MYTSMAEKSRMLLGMIAERSRPGNDAEINPWHDAPLIDAIDENEFNFYLGHLRERNLVRDSSQTGIELTFDGWRQLEPGPGGLPGRCFVAMSFNRDLLSAWQEGIEPALSQDCHLDPCRLDRDEYNDRIDDRIIVEIRRAEFLVADVTGHRPSVYFEAGFAMALGRQVIWTCREDHSEMLHFDTRQYPHIVWTTPADLRQKLATRVQATIPSAQARLGRNTP